MQGSGEEQRLQADGDADRFTDATGDMVPGEHSEAAVVDALGAAAIAEPLQTSAQESVPVVMVTDESELSTLHLNMLLYSRAGYLKGVTLPSRWGEPMPIPTAEAIAEAEERYNHDENLRFWARAADVGSFGVHLPPGPLSESDVIAAQNAIAQSKQADEWHTRARRVREYIPEGVVQARGPLSDTSTAAILTAEARSEADRKLRSDIFLAGPEIIAYITLPTYGPIDPELAARGRQALEDMKTDKKLTDDVHELSGYIDVPAFTVPFGANEREILRSAIHQAQVAKYGLRPDLDPASLEYRQALLEARKAELNAWRGQLRAQRQARDNDNTSE